MPPSMTRVRLAWTLTAAWACLIFVLSSIPGRNLPRIELMTHDKLLHATVYSVLGGLCFLALRATVPIGTGRLIALAVLLAALYGLSDEFHQLFVPGRSADLRDAAADTAGALVGASIALGLMAGKPTRAG